MMSQVYCFFNERCLLWGMSKCRRKDLAFKYKLYLPWIGVALFGTTVDDDESGPKYHMPPHGYPHVA